MGYQLVKIIVIAFSLFWLGAAHATVTITSIQRASDSDTTQGAVVIYGGVAGDVTANPNSGGCGNATPTTSTCDNCTTDFKSCNKVRIHDNLKLRIEFTSTAAGFSKMVTTDGDKVGEYSTSTFAAGSTASLEIDWGDICNDVGEGTTGCETVANFQKSVNIGIGANSGDNTIDDSLQITLHVHDPIEMDAAADTIDDCNANNGICDFVAFPGDNKLFLTPDGTQKAGDFPNASNINYEFVRVYFGEVKADVNYGSSNFVDLQISQSEETDLELDDIAVEGPENGKIYFVRVAVVDEAKNISYMTSDTAYTNECGGDESPGACDYVVQPDEVFGLLSEDFNCFIATAAYGTQMEPKLATFREFRNKILLPNKWGKKFVKSYYNFGPKWARYISQDNNLRGIVRVLLWPAWGFAYLSLIWGAWNTILFFATLILLPILILQWMKKQNSQGRQISET